MMCLIQLSVATPHCGNNIFKQSYRSLSRGFGSRFANLKNVNYHNYGVFTSIWGMEKSYEFSVAVFSTKLCELYIKNVSPIKKALYKNFANFAVKFSKFKGIQNKNKKI